MNYIDAVNSQPDRSSSQSARSVSQPDRVPDPETSGRYPVCVGRLFCCIELDGYLCSTLFPKVFGTGRSGS